MDRLADELVRGDRVLLFAPGIGSFLSALGSTGFGYLFLLVGGVPKLLGLTTPKEQAFPEFICVQVAVVLACVLGMMVMRGFPMASRLWRRIADVGLAATALGLALNWNAAADVRRPFAISTALLTLAFIVVRSVGFATIVLFRQRIKARREVFLAQRQAAKDAIKRS